MRTPWSWIPSISKIAEQRFNQSTERQNFQALLEDLVSGDRPLEPLLEKRWPDIETWQEDCLEVRFDSESYPRATVMGVHCRDRFGLLYLISHFLSGEGFSIEMAYIRTAHREADDEFYLTRHGRKLEPEEIGRLRRDFAAFRVPRFADTREPGSDPSRPCDVDRSSLSESTIGGIGEGRGTTHG